MLPIMQALLDGAVVQQAEGPPAWAGTTAPSTLLPLEAPPATRAAELGADQAAGHEQPECDASWCDCQACRKPKGQHGASCDLCAQKWVFILSAGRSGSTSLLEGLNSLPGVSLGGENFAMIDVAREMVDRADKLQQRGDSAAFEMKNEHLSADVLCSMQDVFAKLTNHDLGQSINGQQRILGFKELVALPSASQWQDGAKGGAKGVPHLAAGTTNWLDFIDRLFPCARIVFNTRRDVATQSRAIASTFGTARGMPLHKIEQDVRAVNADFERWHAERSRGNSSKARSFMVYAEDLGPSIFTQLARWLGRDCAFTAVPHANDATTLSARAREDVVNSSAWARRNGPYFHRDYASIRSHCGRSAAGPAKAVTLEASSTPPTAARAPPAGLEASTADGGGAAVSLGAHGYEEELDHEVESAECRALPPLPAHPTCAPSAEDVERLLGAEEEQGALWER